MHRNRTIDPSPRGNGNKIPRALAVGAIAVYRSVVSPVIHAIHGPACRFEPSCSEYARDAIAEFGVVRGGAMAIWRIARCNPTGGYGYDPVGGGSSERSFGSVFPSPCKGEGTERKGDQSKKVGF